VHTLSSFCTLVATLGFSSLILLMVSYSYLEEEVILGKPPEIEICS
jgi:hypothetical protein